MGAASKEIGDWETILVPKQEAKYQNLWGDQVIEKKNLFKTASGSLHVWTKDGTSVVWIEQGFKYFCPYFCFCQPFILYFYEHDMHILPVCMGFPFSPLLQNTLHQKKWWDSQIITIQKCTMKHHVFELQSCWCYVFQINRSSKELGLHSSYCKKLSIMNSSKYKLIWNQL